MARSAFGEIFPLEKKSSRRRRRTFGNEGKAATSETEGRSEASEGTRSSISGFRLITRLVSDVTGATMSGRPDASRPGLPRVDWPSGAFLVAQTPASGAKRWKTDVSSKT